MNYLSIEIRKRLIEKGASIVGFADLKDIPEDQRESYRYGISISVALNPFIIAGIENGPTKDYYNESKCGTCDMCKNLCPSNAALGVNWKVNMDRDNYFDAFKCRDEGRKRSDKLGVEERVCGKCILVCPRTQRYLSQK